MKKIASFLSALLFIPAAYATDQSDHGPYLGGALLISTANWGNSFDSASFAAQQNEIFTDTGFAQQSLGFRFKMGYQFNHYLALEGTVNALPNSDSWTANVTQGSNTGSRVIDINQNSADLMVIGSYLIQKIGLSPYAKAGAAYLWTTLSDSDTVQNYNNAEFPKSNFVPAVGAGLIYQFAVQNMSLYLDYTYYFGLSNVAYSSQTTNTNAYSINQPARNIYDLGMSYLFAL